MQSDVSKKEKNIWCGCLDERMKENKNPVRRGIVKTKLWETNGLVTHEIGHPDMLSLSSSLCSSQ